MQSYTRTGVIHVSDGIPPLLGPDDPAPVTVRNGDGCSPVLIVCDHASNRVPAKLNGLGVPPETLDRHVAYDIGARGVAERLSDRLEIPAVFAGYSRLVIDINRPLDDFTSIREIYDGDIIPANRFLTSEEVAARANTLFHPYHEEIDHRLGRILADGDQPVIVSVHSFTESYRGQTRPWEIGVLSSHDRRLALPTLAGLRAARPDLSVGDNEPYSGFDAYGHTIETHATPHGYANVLLEIRQDVIRSETGQIEYGDLLADVLGEILPKGRAQTSSHSSLEGAA